VTTAGARDLSGVVRMEWRKLRTVRSTSLAAVKPVADQTIAVSDPLSAWAGFGMLCLYAAIALAVGGWALLRRDA
jgi:hypothetical protein